MSENPTPPPLSPGAVGTPVELARALLQTIDGLNGVVAVSRYLAGGLKILGEQQIEGAHRLSALGELLVERGVLTAEEIAARGREKAGDGWLESADPDNLFNVLCRVVHRLPEFDAAYLGRLSPVDMVDLLRRLDAEEKRREEAR